MSRGSSATLKSELSANGLSIVILVKLEFESGTQRYHTGIFDIFYDDDGTGLSTYLGAGELGTIEPIEESLSNKAHGIAISLSGVDTNQLNLVVSENYQGRPATVYLGYYDIENCNLVDAHPIFTGGMDTITISRGEQGSMVLTIEHESSQFDTSKVIRATHEEHLLFTFPIVDPFFQEIAEQTETDIVWGNVAWTGSALPGFGSSWENQPSNRDLYSRDASVISINSGNN